MFVVPRKQVKLCTYVQLRHLNVSFGIKGLTPYACIIRSSAANTYVHVVHLESSRKVFLILVCLLKFVLREVDVNHLWFDLGTGSKNFAGVFTWATGAIR